MELRRKDAILRVVARAHEGRHLARVEAVAATWRQNGIHGWLGARVAVDWMT